MFFEQFKQDDIFDQLPDMSDVSELISQDEVYSFFSA